jgi:GAF domain-containing protein
MTASTPNHPQDALAELAKITLADHSLDQVMGKVATLAKQTLNVNGEVSVTLVRGNQPSTIASTGALATDLDERQYDSGYGPCLDCINGGLPLLVPDMANEPRWADWSKAAAYAGARSSLSIPMPVQREVAAAINIYSTEPDAFDEAAVELGMTLAAYAAVAVANIHVYETQAQVAEQLRQAMQSRAVIEQAKGILMGQRRCTSQEAFDILVTLSQGANRKLRDVAQALVDQATSG